MIRTSASLLQKSGTAWGYRYTTDPSRGFILLRCGGYHSSLRTRVLIPYLQLNVSSVTLCHSFHRFSQKNQARLPAMFRGGWDVGGPVRGSRPHRFFNSGVILFCNTGQPLNTSTQIKTPSRHNRVDHRPFGGLEIFRKSPTFNSAGKSATGY